MPLNKEITRNKQINMRRRVSCDVMVKAMDCEILISEFEPQSRYYIHFRANTFGKGMIPLSSQQWVKW